MGVICEIENEMSPYQRLLSYFKVLNIFSSYWQADKVVHRHDANAVFTKASFTYS